MDFLQTKIMEILEKNGCLNKMELTEKTGFHRKTVVKALFRLIKLDIVEGEFKTTNPHEYRRNERFYLK